MSVATVDVYCHCRCLFIVIPYNRINLNHDRINLNLVGAPRRPLVIALTLPYVRYATGGNGGFVCLVRVNTLFYNVVLCNRSVYVQNI